VRRARGVEVVVARVERRSAREPDGRDVDVLVVLVVVLVVRVVDGRVVVLVVVVRVVDVAGVVRVFEVMVGDPDVWVEVDVDELLVDGGGATVVVTVDGEVEPVVADVGVGASVVVLVDVVVEPLELLELLELESEQLSLNVTRPRSTVPGWTAPALTSARSRSF
jgi:hypothetical protein